MVRRCALVLLGLSLLVACDPSMIDNVPGDRELDPARDASGTQGTQDAGPSGGPGSVTDASDTADASPTGGGASDASLVPDASITPAIVCDQPVLTVPDGKHRAGQTCMNGDCHGAGGEGPRFATGGTLYQNGDPAKGATITVTDSAGVTVKMVVAKNGNFWTTQTLQYPVTVRASLCPSIVPMVAKVQAPGDCNGCHGSANRITLP